MSGPTTPGSPPPEVPEEFAAAYRAAYEQALAAQTGGAQHRDLPEEPGDEPDDEPGDEPGDAAEAPLPRRRGPIRIGTHREAEPVPYEYDDDGPTWFESVRDSGWLVPFLLALLALLLVFGAYAVGKRFAAGVDDGTSGAEPRVVLGEGSDSGDQPVSNQKPGKGAWRGQVTRVRDVQANAGCTSKPGVDASGRPVSYGVGHLTDGIADTTWRCNGSAVGQKITLSLGKRVPVGQVGLIPGYAKTDEKSKQDRYAENNRITRVRWTIGKAAVIQRMSGSPTDRDLQLVRVPRTTTETVTLEILAVREGPRDTTAISEIQLGRAG